MKKLDVIIIGAGSAGLSARREVAKKTENYIVVDGGILGTTCARVGCMPSKVLIQVAEDFYRQHKFQEQGIHLNGSLSLDYSEVMNHVRALRDRFVRGVTGDMKDWMETNFVKGYAEFVDKNTLRINEELYYADKIIIAVGTTPSIPKELLGFEEFLLTTDSFFEEKTLPKSIAVIGLGVIGLELGQALSKLGIETFGIARRKSLASISDPKLLDYVHTKFSEQMNLSFDGIASLERKDHGVLVRSGSKEIFVEKILVTSGRKLNLDKLKIENIGLSANEKMILNHENMKLEKFDHIFIGGDITSERQILHEASDEGRIAGYNSVNELVTFKRRTPLLIAFTEPNIAFVGQKYEDLVETKANFEIGEVSFEGQGRSIIKLKEIGMLRIYGCPLTERILGAELMAPDGEHLAHLISWAIANEMTVTQTLSMPFYHPVVEEGLRTSLRNLQSKITKKPPPLEIPLNI